MDHRVERDSFGEIEIEPGAYWGSQTQRTLMNFPQSRQKLPDNFIRSLAWIKKCAAKVNHKLGKLEEHRCQAIIHAAAEVISGKMINHFPLSMWQSGSGTQTNMNVNEVIANRANELIGGRRGDDVIHPNDHVNMGQSTNDTFSAAMQICCFQMLASEFLPSIGLLESELMNKALEFNDNYKIGRTHLMDAVPMRVGKEFETWADQIRIHREHIQSLMGPLAQLPLGGTAIGSGLNAGHDFGKLVAYELSQALDLPFKEASNKYTLISAHDPLVNLSGALRGLATALNKMANDIRLLGSGPHCGLKELRLPANEAGSSIMPGKVNPTQCELLTMICAQVIGNDLAITLAGAQGQFQLNAFKPLMITNLVDSLSSLGQGCFSFAIRCIKGIEINQMTMSRNVESSLMVVTALAPKLGYEQAANMATTAFKNNTSIREEVLSRNLLSEEEYDQLVSLKSMIPE